MCVVKLVKMLSQAACVFFHTCFLKLKKEEALSRKPLLQLIASKGGSWGVLCFFHSAASALSLHFC